MSFHPRLFTVLVAGSVALATLAGCSSAHKTNSAGTAPTTSAATTISSSSTSSSTTSASSSAPNQPSMEIEAGSSLVVISASSASCSTAGGKLSISESGNGHETGGAPVSASFTLTASNLTSPSYMSLTPQNSSATLTVGNTTYSGYQQGSFLAESGNGSIHAFFNNAQITTALPCAA